MYFKSINHKPFQINVNVSILVYTYFIIKLLEIGRFYLSFYLFILMKGIIATSILLSSFWMNTRNFDK